MDEKNQILDVTYGNFSCRLEGFDDSVETMKTVVSFFHDLAGHDRFMDVTPQAPDMATLARLTEEQTGVAVEVEGEGNHVSLRAIKEDVAEEFEEDIEGDVEDDFEDDLATDDTDELAAEGTEEPPTEDSVDDEEMAMDMDASVSDKLDRIRAVVDRDAEAAESEDFAEDLAEADQKPRGINPLAQRLADLAKRTSKTRILDPTNDYIQNDVAMAAEDAATPFEDVSEETVDDMTANLEAESDENVFAEEATDDAAADADEPVAEIEDIEDEAEEIVAETDLEDDLSVEEAIEDEIEDVAEEAVQDIEDATDEVLEEADLEAAEELSQEAVADEVEEAIGDLETESEDENVEAVQFEEEAETFENPDDTLSETDAEDVAEDDVAESDEDSVVAKARETSTTLVLTPSDVADPVPEGVDPVKVETATDDDFDLATEVALVEAEIARRQGNEVARHGLSRRVEDAMSRIMSQTDQHLAKPESRRHRDAFAQLKAAVAATEAARQLGDKGGDAPDPDEAFKNDLGAHAAGPSDVEDSDKIKPLDAASERLRQIASTKEAEGVSETKGFAEFADAHGAVDLVDLLEAAGAYICHVEGEADFSRPQVMKVVQTASDKEISREDGLRCFGRLLRQTRIVKLANGRFQVADTSQYRPDDAQAARAQ